MFGQEVVASARIVMLRAGLGGLAGPHEASNLSRLRSGLRKGAPCLQAGQGEPRGGALTEVWRHFNQLLRRGGLPRLSWFELDGAFARCEVRVAGAATSSPRTWFEEEYRSIVVS